MDACVEGAPTAGIVLAAGGGRRLGGRPKALLPYGDELLVDRAVRVLREGGCARVHVVLGAAAREVRRRARLAGCVVVENADWEQGMGGSLRAGLASLAGTGVAAAVVTLVDQPGVGAPAVRRVLAGASLAADPRAVLAAAAYHGRRGHPVLLGAAHWPGVAAAAAGDRGARAYLAGRADEVTLVECGDVAAPDDIDVPADLRLLERGPAAGRGGRDSGDDEDGAASGTPSAGPVDRPPHATPAPPPSRTRPRPGGRTWPPGS